MRENVPGIPSACATHNLSIEKIKEYYKNDIRYFDFQTVDADTVMLMLKNLD